MKVFVRCAVLELGFAFGMGFFLGKYLEKKVVVTVKDGEEVQTNKKKSVTYTDGKLVIDLKR